MIFFSYYKLKKDLRWLDFSYQNSLENLLTSEWLKSNATIIINRKNKFNKQSHIIIGFYHNNRNIRIP